MTEGTEPRRTGRKPWSTPELFRVSLDPQQAVLGTCSGAYTNAADSHTAKCTSGGCRKSEHGAGDSSGAS